MQNTPQFKKDRMPPKTGNEKNTGKQETTSTDKKDVLASPRVLPQEVLAALEAMRTMIAEAIEERPTTPENPRSVEGLLKKWLGRDIAKPIIEITKDAKTVKTQIYTEPDCYGKQQPSKIVIETDSELIVVTEEGVNKTTKTQNLTSYIKDPFEKSQFALSKLSIPRGYKYALVHEIRNRKSHEFWTILSTNPITDCPANWTIERIKGDKLEIDNQETDNKNQYIMQAYRGLPLIIPSSTSSLDEGTLIDAYMAIAKSIEKKPSK